MKRPAIPNGNFADAIFSDRRRRAMALIAPRCTRPVTYEGRDVTTTTMMPSSRRWNNTLSRERDDAQAIPLPHRRRRRAMFSVVMCPRSTVSSKVLALLRRCFSVSCPACLSPQSPRVCPADGDRADRVDCQRTTTGRLPSSRKIRSFVPLRKSSFQRLMSANCSDKKALSLSGRPHANTPFLPFRKNSRGTTCAPFFCTIYTLVRFSLSNTRPLEVMFQPHFYYTFRIYFQIGLSSCFNCTSYVFRFFRNCTYSQFYFKCQKCNWQIK